MKNLKKKLEVLWKQYPKGPAEQSFISTAPEFLANYIEQLSRELESVEPLFEELWESMWIERGRDFW